MPDTHAASLRWSARIIETNAFALLEQEAGPQAGDHAPILCLGFSDPAASRVLDDLAQNFRLIALAPAAVPLSAAEALDAHSFALEALAFANRLGLVRFNVLARGDDNHAALCLALIEPQRVTGVALIAPDLHSRDGAAQDAQLMEKLAQVRAPVLAIFGANPHHARLWRERLPACQVMFFANAGSQPDRERPHALARAAAAFLRTPG